MDFLAYLKNTIVDHFIMFFTVHRTDGTGEIGTQRGTLLTSLQSILVQAEPIQVKS